MKQSLKKPYYGFSQSNASKEEAKENTIRERETSINCSTITTPIKTHYACTGIYSTTVCRKRAKGVGKLFK